MKKLIFNGTLSHKAHTVTPGNTQGSYQMYCIDLNPDPDVTELARCITTRQDNGITHRRGEHSGALMMSDAPIPVLTPAKEKADVMPIMTVKG